MTKDDASLVASLDGIRRRIGDADRLIKSAAEAVDSFFVETPGGFIGFARDTTEPQSQARMSTGGFGVTSVLYQLEPHLPYLRSTLGYEAFNRLTNDRDQARAWLLDVTHKIDAHGAFGPSNPLSTSVIAYQLASMDDRSARSDIFELAALAQVQQDWPSMPTVTAPHPYVAACAFHAAQLVANSPHLGELVAKVPTKVFEDANLRGWGELSKLARGLKKRTLDISEIRTRFLTRARQYLWQQHSLAVSRRSTGISALSYDPTGACFALDILVEAATSNAQDGVTSPPLAEHSDLIERTVSHILEGMAPNGSLAYGLPFSYNPKGMGAFATSFAGVAALTRALTRIFVLSRHAFYGNASWLETLLGDKSARLGQLFELPAVIAGSRRVVSDSEKQISGWSTDRAPAVDRIESWVTVDVLSFAVNTRILLQEVAQFLVLSRYGGGPVVGEPDWPYKATDDDFSGRQSQRDGRAFLDPDQMGGSEAEAGTARRLAPVQVLHRDYKRFMDRHASIWTAESASYLLFGPPGTAKSTLVKSLAMRLAWHFLELTPSHFVDRGLELIEQRATEIFDDLGQLRETVIFFDELDSLLIDREQLEAASILTFSVPAMLPKLQRLRTIALKQRLLLVFATNFYDRLDPAMVRRGRVDERLLVLPPNNLARTRFLESRWGDRKAVDAVVLKDTALYVHEDLVRYAKEALSDSAQISEAGITPSLYYSRIPEPENRNRRVRSMERLALEICEVCRRNLDLARKLNADSSHSEIVSELGRLKEELGSDSPWAGLCAAMETALIPRKA